MPSRAAVACALIALFVAERAHAWEFRLRFVERVGNQSIPLPFTTHFDASDLSPHRLRLEFGVFDNDAGPAPAGGFIGWNVGTVAVGGPEDNSDERRTPGRIAPFNFAAHPGSNGNPPLPQGDPFTMLSDIDATLGTQSRNWFCDLDGEPLPMPQALVRGLNTYVSVYEITIDPRDAAASYTLAFTGNLIAATEWRVIGNPVPPECPEDPNDPTDPPPSNVIYAPLTTPPHPFSHTLTIIVPGPASVGVLGVFACRSGRRRREG